jgi:hypothetical protein
MAAIMKIHHVVGCVAECLAGVVTKANYLLPYRTIDIDSQNRSMPKLPKSNSIVEYGRRYNLRPSDSGWYMI